MKVSIDNMTDAELVRLLRIMLRAGMTETMKSLTATKDE